MRTTTFLTVLLFTAGTLTSYAQTTTPPAAKTLTPAEQKRKEKLEKDIQEQRKFKAEMAERQRQYFAEQAEKERKKKEKEAEREAKKRAESAPSVSTETPRATAAPPAQPNRRNTTAPAATAPAVPTATPTVEPSAVAPSDADREKEVRRAADAARKEQGDRDKAARLSQTNQDREAARLRAKQQREANRLQNDLDRKQAKQQREAEQERVRLAKLQQRQQTDIAPVAPTTRPDTVEAFGPRKEFLPKNHLFEPILLDPLQSQTYGSLLPVFISNGKRYGGSIVPFAFGVQKPFFRRQTGTNRASEWALDVASFTQFEVYQDEKLNKQRRQLVNTDYRVGISYHLRRGPGTWRFRAYHLSSHLGDDYIIRNQLNFRLPNAVNYELFDATYSRQVRDFRVYGGLGVGLRVSEERKPISAQAGFWYKKPTTKTTQLVGGIDMKLWQQTGFRPGVKAGIGATVGRGPGNLTFLLETYSGFRPYSIYESDRIFWLGFGVYLQPF